MGGARGKVAFMRGPVVVKAGLSMIYAARQISRSVTERSVEVHTGTDGFNYDS